MSAHALSNLLNKLRKNEMRDSVYHKTLKSLFHDFLH